MTAAITGSATRHPPLLLSKTLAMVALDASPSQMLRAS